MRELPPDFLEKSHSVFIDNLGVTLLDVRRDVEKEPEGITRRDRLSALAAVTRLFGLSLHRVPASRAGLQKVFGDRHPEELGISKSRFYNIRCDLLAAIKAHAVLMPTLTDRISPSPAWVVLLEKVRSPDYASGIRRFACFCTTFGLEPADVRPGDLLLGFHEALQGEGLIKNPRTTLNLTITYWNMQMKRIPGWPQVRLRSPFPSKTYSFPLEDFPASFVADLARWQNRQTEIDIFADEGPPKAKRHVTLEHQSAMIRRFASLAVKLGVLSLAQVDSLAALLPSQVVHPCLQWHLQTGKGTRQIENIVHLLLSIARHYSRASTDCIKKLAGYAQRLRKRRQKGLAPKNKEQLKQFDDPENVKKLLLLPFRIVEKVPPRISEHRQAKYFERALSIGLFVYTGLRIQNVRTIHLDRNIRRSGGKIMLTFIAEEMKNHRSLELELHPRVFALFEEYLANHRRHLPGSADSRYLFPGRDGGPRPAATVREDLRRTVSRWTRIRITPHQVRHFSAKVAIDASPSHLMAVSQRLGHVNPDTTIEYYLPNGSLPASRVMNEILEEAAKTEKQAKKKHKGTQHGGRRRKTNE